MTKIISRIAACVLATGIASAATILAPSGVLAHPAKFDRKSVTVLGIVQNVAVRPAGAGTVLTSFQVCDSMCVNVLQAGPSTVANGQNATVSGTFYTFLLRGAVQARNVIVEAP
jgi:hypothetical protein